MTRAGAFAGQRSQGGRAGRNTTVPQRAPGFRNVEETVLSETRKTSRRNFLLAVGAGGAATAVAIAARNPVTAKPAARTESARQDKGYEETAHVRNYYRTTRV